MDKILIEITKESFNLNIYLFFFDNTSTSSSILKWRDFNANHSFFHLLFLIFMIRYWNFDITKEFFNSNLYIYSSSIILQMKISFSLNLSKIFLSILEEISTRTISSFIYYFLYLRLDTRRILI